MTRSRRWLVAAAAALLLLAVLQLREHAHAGQAQSDRDTVVLLHGLGRTSWSMLVMGWELESAGFRVVNIDYPSTDHDIPTLSRDLAAELERCCSAGKERIHFVTHSMGGILVRQFLAHHDLPRLGRVVMLSPPTRAARSSTACATTPSSNTGWGRPRCSSGPTTAAFPTGSGRWISSWA